MKIKKSELKKLIKEEIGAVLNERSDAPPWVDRGSMTMAEDALLDVLKQVVKQSSYDRAREHVEAAFYQVPRYYKENEYLHPITNMKGSERSEEIWSIIDQQSEPRKTIFQGINNALAYSGYRAQRDKQQAEALGRDILSRLQRDEETIGDL